MLAAFLLPENAVGRKKTCIREPVKPVQGGRLNRTTDIMPDSGLHHPGG